MDGVHIHAVAHPGNGFAIRSDDKPGKFADWIRWRVRAGKPLGVKQRNVAALYWDRLMHGQYATADISNVDEQRNCAGIRRISRRNDRRKQRQRLRSGRILSMHGGR